MTGHFIRFHATAPIDHRSTQYRAGKAKGVVTIDWSTLESVSPHMRGRGYSSEDLRISVGLIEVVLILAPALHGNQDEPELI